MSPRVSVVQQQAAARFTIAAGILPAVLWIVYAYSNVVTAEPPRLGPVTAINILYLAMLPAVAIAAVHGQAFQVAGVAAFAAFFGWVVIGLAWYDSAYPVEIVKQLIIYGLFVLTAAQIVVAGRAATRALAIGTMIAAAGLSLWTIWYAMSTGFAYRAGVPINPNLPAMLIGAGLTTAVSIYLDRTRRRHGLVLVIAMLSLYACLLLGSRGVLLGLVAAAVTLWVRTRPALAEIRGLVAGGAVVVALSLVPAVPFAVWQAATSVVQRVQSWGTGSGEPAAATAGGSAAAGTPASRSRAVVAMTAPRALDPKAVGSTAIGRFGEGEVTSFNLRRDLWVAALWHQVAGPGAFLIGGGLGTSQDLAHATNPVFWNMHNTPLQVWVDFGLVGLGLFAWLHWRIVRALWMTPGWPGTAGLVGLTFWLVVGLTATAADMHVYWMALGASAAAAMRPISSEAAVRPISSTTHR